MSSGDLNRDSWRQLVSDTVHAADFRRATFGGAVRGAVSSLWVRVVVHPVDIGGERHLQFSYFDEKKHIAKNYRGKEIGPRLDELLDVGFAGIHLTTSSAEVDVRTTKKGKVLVGRRPVK